MADSELRRKLSEPRKRLAALDGERAAIIAEIEALHLAAIEEASSSYAASDQPDGGVHMHSPIQAKIALTKLPLFRRLSFKDAGTSAAIASPSSTRGKSRMPEWGSSGSVRGTPAMVFPTAIGLSASYGLFRVRSFGFAKEGLDVDGEDVHASGSKKSMPYRGRIAVFLT